MAYNEIDAGLEKHHQRAIKGILGNHFIQKDIKADRELGQDFAIYVVRPFTVGVRIRRYRWLVEHGDEFTIRWSRPKGKDTDIDKIRQGLVDYLLYGFQSPNGNMIVKYFIGDLRVFMRNEPKPFKVAPNDPPDSELAAYHLKDMPEGFVVEVWEESPEHAVIRRSQFNKSCDEECDEKRRQSISAQKISQ